jgi:hypothetical protein
MMTAEEYVSRSRLFLVELYAARLVTDGLAR